MSYLDRIRSCNTWDPEHFRPLLLEGEPVGMLLHGFADSLRRWPEVFEVDRDKAVFASKARDMQSRSLAVRGVLEEMLADGTITHLHGEKYPVTGRRRHPVHFLIDRAAAPYFGVRAFGQHLNGYVRTPDGIKLWIGRRSADRRQFPGKLDNIVAGGLPFGIGLRENILKECQEEAGIGPGLASRAIPVAAVTYCCETEKGLKPDVLYCYDLELPKEFQPRCTDGEMEEFYLWPVEKVAEIVRDTGDFKLNCNLVVIDFLLRHGVISHEEPDYLEIQQGLHQSLELRL